MKLSSKARYGVRALFDLAFHAAGSAAQIKDIAERQGIPPRFLEQIFQDLRRAGLVTSKRGPRGGYQLSREPREVSIGDVVQALEGPVSIGSEDDAEPGGDAASIAVTEGAFGQLATSIEACLKAVSLEELCDRAQRSGVRRSPPTGYVYVI
jgi:Rrf2 family transcriptional regulator, iron-sulfur cluster assembly transcription factor